MAEKVVWTVSDASWSDLEALAGMPVVEWRVTHSSDRFQHTLRGLAG